MNSSEMDPDWTYVTIAEFEENSGPPLLVPTTRMSSLIVRAVGDAIPNIQCPDEAEEARSMVAFLESYIGRPEMGEAA